VKAAPSCKYTPPQLSDFQGLLKNPIPLKKGEIPDFLRFPPSEVAKEMCKEVTKILKEKHVFAAAVSGAGKVRI